LGDRHVFRQRFVLAFVEDTPNGPLDDGGKLGDGGDDDG